MNDWTEWIRLTDDLDRNTSEWVRETHSEWGCGSGWERPEQLWML